MALWCSALRFVDMYMTRGITLGFVAGIDGCLYTLSLEYVPR